MELHGFSPTTKVVFIKYYVSEMNELKHENNLAKLINSMGIDSSTCHKYIMRFNVTNVQREVSG